MTMNFEKNLNKTGVYLTVCFISPLFTRVEGAGYSRIALVLFKNLFFQLILLFISSSSPFPYFSSLKSGLVVPKQADMKLTNAQVSTLAFSLFNCPGIPAKKTKRRGHAFNWWRLSFSTTVNGLKPLFGATLTNKSNYKRTFVLLNYETWNNIFQMVDTRISKY